MQGARGTSECNLKAPYIWQIATKFYGVGTCLFFFFLGVFFSPSANGVFVRFSTRRVQKHRKNIFGEVHVKKVLPKKLRETKNPVVCFLRFCYRVFGRFSA
jgi:hypothetical protein